MALYTFLGAKSHEWTFCDPIKIRYQKSKVKYLDFWYVDNKTVFW